MEFTNITKSMVAEIESLNTLTHGEEALKIVKELNSLAVDLLAESTKVENAIQRAIESIEEASSQADDIQYNAKEAKDELEDLEFA